MTMGGLLRIAAAVAIALTLASPALAVQPDEILKDPALEARARALSRELRCMVCQNQSIDDSDADLARDLRLLVRERISAGDTDQQALDYITARYGDFVLLDPPFKATTVLLWVGPLLLLMVGAWVLMRVLRARRRLAAPALTDDERRRAEALLAGKETRP